MKVMSAEFVRTEASPRAESWQWYPAALRDPIPRLKSTGFRINSSDSWSGRKKRLVDGLARDRRWGWLEGTGDLQALRRDSAGSQVVVAFDIGVPEGILMDWRWDMGGMASCDGGRHGPSPGRVPLNWGRNVRRNQAERYSQAMIPRASAAVGWQRGGAVRWEWYGRGSSSERRAKRSGATSQQSVGAASSPSGKSDLGRDYPWCQDIEQLESLAALKAEIS